MKAAAVGHKPPSERSIWQNDCRSVGEDDFAKLWHYHIIEIAAYGMTL